MKKYIYISIIAALTLLAACSDELEEVNVNPNETENPISDYVLTATEKAAGDVAMSYAVGYHGSILWVQHWADRNYPQTDQYDVSVEDFADLWDEGYATIMTNMDGIIAKNENDAWVGVASIIRSWIFYELTTAYGYVPYTEAGLTSTPKYDSQETIFLGLNEDLKAAVALIDADGEDEIGGDLIYDNDLEKWQRFGNSLRLRIALTISDRDAATAKEIITEVANDVLQSNDDIARFYYTSYPQSNPYYSSVIYGERYDYAVSEQMINTLKELDDPRLYVYAEPTGNDATQYVGVKNGNKSEKGSVSMPGSIFEQDSSPVLFFTYAEVLFAKAEAVARGLLSGDAESYYKAGIRASLEQYDVDEADIVAYLANDAVAYDATNYKKSIGIQKWLALYTEGLDAFTEWRRLDYPELEPADNSMLSAGQIPLRFYYPGTEQTLNGNSYTEAIAEQGAESLVTRLWFDVY